MKTILTAIICAGVLMFGGVGMVLADTIYAERTIWENNTTNIQLVDFNGFTDSFKTIHPTYVIDGVTFNSPSWLVLIDPITSTNHPYASYMTSDYLEWQWETGGSAPTTLNVVLPKNVTALGFDFGKLYGGIDVFSINIGSDTYATVTSLNEYAFWGITTDIAFNNFSITSTKYPIIDNLSYGDTGTPIPEPSTLLLLGVGLVALGHLRRKVKQ